MYFGTRAAVDRKPPLVVTVPRMEAERTQSPVSLTMARIAKRPRTSNAALNIRMDCVLGLMNRHTPAQSAATSHARKIKTTILPNMIVV